RLSFSSRGRHTSCYRDWSSDVCSSDLIRALDEAAEVFLEAYAACGGSPVAAHLPFYKAALWLRGAKKDVKTKPLGWRQWAEAKQIGRASCRERVYVSVVRLARDWESGR